MALMRFFIISKLLKKMALITHERSTETPRPLYEPAEKTLMLGRAA